MIGKDRRRCENLHRCRTRRSGGREPVADPEPRAGFGGVIVVASDRRDRRAAADPLGQVPQADVLIRREMPLEAIGRGRTKATQQADVDDASVMPLDTGADHGFRPASRPGPVAIDQPMIADVAPTVVADMPAPDFGDPGPKVSVAIQSGRVALQWTMISRIG